MGLGLGPAYGLANVREELKQRLLAQIAEQERQRKGGLDERRMKLEEGEFKQRGDLLAQQQAERKAKLDADIAARREDDAAKAAPQIGMGQNISPEAYDASFKGTGSESLFAPQVSLSARPTMGVTDLNREQVSSPAAPLPQMKTGRLVMTGTAGQQEAERKKNLGSELLDNPALTPFQRIQMQAETAGLKAPTAEPKPSTQLYPVGPQGVLTPHDEAIGQPGYHPPQQTPTVVIQTVDEKGNPVQKVVPKTAGSTFAAPVTAQTRAMSEGAKMLQPHIEQTRALGQELEKAGLFGPVMSRVRHAAETAGSLDDFAVSIESDPELQKDERIGKFSTMLGLLATGAGRVHGGARGGGSPQMFEHFKKMLSDVGTYQMFSGRLDALDTFMSGYAAGPAGHPETTAAKGTIRARDPQGRLHEAPAGTPLPSGWKVEK